MGWIGPTKRVEEWLIAHGAERAPTGEYLVEGSRPVFGLGGDEIVIPDDTYVIVAGAKVNLADALNASGGGVGVRVISEYQENPLAINHDYPRAHALQSDLTRYYEECKRSKSARGRFIGGRLKQYCSGVAWKRIHLAGRYKDYARYKGKKSMRRTMPVRRAAEHLEVHDFPEFDQALLHMKSLGWTHYSKVDTAESFDYHIYRDMNGFWEEARIYNSRGAWHYDFRWHHARAALPADAKPIPVSWGKPRLSSSAEMLQNPFVENQLSPSGMWALGIAGIAALGIGAYLLFRAKPPQTTTASYAYPTSQNYTVVPAFQTPPLQVGAFQVAPVQVPALQVALPSVRAF